ncbi:MAG: DUF1015 domain-containing protein [Endomicrobiia bacterium]|nr:DUF1015 domain-containing protein [Endomicrobiia bacterium]
MAKISPLEGIRYKAKNLSRLICPPYDIVSSARRKNLLALSKDNFISVELPVSFPKSPAHKIKNMPGSSPRPYAAAARGFRYLLARGIMTRDASSYYIYTQKFTLDGKKLERTGIIAAVRLENPARGAIYPHENILPKPARDRELLLDAVRASTSPVFFLTDSRDFESFIVGIKKRSRFVSRARMDGVSQELRAVSPDVAVVESFFKNKRLYIADGHHRYDVAWRYSLTGSNPAARYVLGFITGAFDEGTVVLPTHRIAPVPENLEAKLKLFDIVSASRFKQLERKSVSSCVIPQPLKIRLDGKTLYLRVKNKKILTDGLPRVVPRALAYIAPSVAAATLLSGVRPDQMRYTSSEREAMQAADREKKLAVILPPPPMKAIIEISRRRAHMPQKSTYFYPKVYAGFVVYPH